MALDVDPRGNEPAQDAIVPDNDIPYSPQQEGDPLVALGLLDPKTGKPLATEDWDPAGSISTPSAGTQPGSGSPDWESPENPYRQQFQQFSDPSVQGRMYLETKVQQIQSQAQAAYALLVNQHKLDPQIAEALVGSKVEAAVYQARSEAEHIALFPQVERDTAEKIAKQHSQGDVVINPDELRGQGSVAAMEARAATLAETRRTARTETRVARGIDRAEGGPPAGSRLDYNALTPQQMIKLGVARGD